MTPPKFTPRRKPEGFWYLEVTWPNGRTEKLEDFPTAAEAEAAGKARLDAWTEGKQHYDRPLVAGRHRTPVT